MDFNSKVLKWFDKFTPEKVIIGETNSIVPLLVKMYRAQADVIELRSHKDSNISYSITDDL